MRHSPRIILLAAMTAAVLAATGCGTKSSSGTGDAATGPGVTRSTIKLGMLLDLSGAFAGTGKVTLAGTQLAIDEINGKGGVCGRQIELVTRDHGYDTQKGVTAYDEVAPQVLGFVNILGSGILSALRDKVRTDEVLAGVTSYSSFVLDEHLIVLGPTYDIQAINGVDWLIRQGGVKAGDTIGHIYQQGEYGENSWRGSQFAAERLGLKIVGQQIKPTDSDFTAQVNALKAAGVTAVMVDATPKQTASIAALAQASGLDVPILGGVPTFGTSLLSTSAAPALIKRFHRVSGFGTLSANNDGARALVAGWKAKQGNTPLESNGALINAYVLANLFATILGKTCDTLTRPAVLDARRKVTDFSMPGLIPTLDFSDPTRPSSLETQVHSPDQGAFGGVTVTEDFRVSQLAREYKFPVTG